MKKSISLIVVAISLGFLHAGEQKTVEMTLHDFMHDYTKPIMKKYKATGDATKLKMIIKAIPGFALDEHRDKWQKITEKALASNELEESCAKCHKPYKKPYKKSYRKRPIQVPVELLKQLESK